MTIRPDLMGDVWPVIQPGLSCDECASARIDTPGRYEVRTYHEIRITVVAGKFGFDDTGGFRVSFRWTYDGGKFQTHDPAAANYVTASSPTGTKIKVHIEGQSFRSWDKAIRFEVIGGSLKAGDEIHVVFGDRSQGSPGFLMQSFAEDDFEFRISADPCATSHFTPLNDKLSISVVPGAAVRWAVRGPTRRRPGATATVTIVGEDVWGNASDQVEGSYSVVHEAPSGSKATALEWERGKRASRIDLTPHEPGRHRVKLLSAGGEFLAEGPVLTVGEGLQSYWADLHGQSGETVGIGTIQEYYAFARDIGGVDVCIHQANDFQIKDKFWSEINIASIEFNRDGKFVTFPGYEWSANTSMGGDHNVIYLHEGNEIYRSSFAMIEDRSSISSAGNTLPELYSALDGSDALLIAHVGGRPANLRLPHNPALRLSVELHSDWGTFEWMLHDSFELGYRVGVVANSDGHKGQPGASYPGASSFGAYGGLTCIQAPSLSRSDIFAALRNRRHYATTGSRLHINVNVEVTGDGDVYEVDPSAGNAVPSSRRNSVVMGEIIHSESPSARVSVEVDSASPILSVDLFRSSQLVETFRTYDEGDLGRRLRFLCHGAEYRGRGRQVDWAGTIKTDEALLLQLNPVNWWNPEMPIELVDGKRVSFRAVTSGNNCGFDFDLDYVVGKLSVETNVASGTIDLEALSLEPVLFSGGGLDKGFSVQRLPSALKNRTFKIDRQIDLFDADDTPIWVRVRTLDGHTAWTSPVYIIRRLENLRS